MPSSKMCDTRGCEAAVCARGLCGSHYSQWLRETPPELRPPPEPRVPDFDELYRKTHEHGCWVWDPERRNKTGYGTYKKVLAHRYSWRRVNGDIPEGLEICHHCDNPPCVNPAHLYAGTHAQNMRDMAARGRSYSPPPKDVCDYGHEMVGGNVQSYTASGGEVRRNCRECMRGHSRKYNARVRSEMVASRPPPPEGRIDRNAACARFKVSPRTLNKYTSIGVLTKPVIYVREGYYLVVELEEQFEERRSLQGASG